MATSRGYRYSTAYKYFLDLIYRFFGRDLPLVWENQHLLGIATVGLIFLIGRRFFGIGRGCAAALLYNFYGPAPMAILSGNDLRYPGMRFRLDLQVTEYISMGYWELATTYIKNAVSNPFEMFQLYLRKLFLSFTTTNTPATIIFNFFGNTLSFYKRLFLNFIALAFYH